METNAELTQLVESLIHLIGRLAIPAESVIKIVGTNSQYIRAFNLCNGANTQGEIARKVKIAQSNLSRAYKRWVNNGIAFWLGEGTNVRLLHVYPIPETPTTKRVRSKHSARKAHGR